MKMNNQANRPLERQLQIFGIVLKHLKQKPDEETFNIRFESFSNQHPLLRDRDGLEIAFEKINTGKLNNGAINISFDFVSMGKMTTATDDGGEYGYEVIKIHVEDPERVKDIYNKLKPKKEKDKTKTNKNNKLWIDEKTGILYMGEASCEIPYKGNEYYLLKIILEHGPNEPIDVTDILDSIDPALKDKINCERPVYDAHRSLNDRLEKAFGIEEFIVYKKSTYWRTR